MAIEPSQIPTSPVKNQKRHIFPFSILAALIATGVYLWVSVIQSELDEFNKVSEVGCQVQAVIARRWHTSGRASQSYLESKFEVSNVPYVSVSPVDFSVWESSKIGDAVTVLYLTENPNRNHLSKAKAPHGKLDSWGVVVVGSLLIVLIATACIRPNLL